jgi:hypothetical protein
MQLARKTTFLAALAASFALAGPAYADDAPQAGDTATQTQGTISPEAALDTLQGTASEFVAPSPTTQVNGLQLSPSLQPEAGQYEITGSLGSASIAGDVSNGFALQTDSGPLQIKPVGVDATASDAKVVNGDSVMFANTDSGADTVVRPTSVGIETFTQIRDADAPENYSWTVNLPGDQHLELLADGGAAVVDSAGTRVATVLAPWAKDATGKAVPASFSVDGDTLTMTIRHRGGDYAYPIVADPYWRVHIHRSWNYDQAHRAGQGLRDGGTVAGAFAAAGAALGGPVGAAIIGIIGAAGENIIGSRILDANAESHHRGVNFDAGLRCARVRIIPDPCWPEIWIRPR